MSSYPVILTDLGSRRCLVIGGGEVAARKVQGLLDAGACPIVVSPALCDELEAMAQDGRAIVERRAYRDGDLDGAGLVIAATDDPDVNRRVAEECRRRGILVNVVDRPSSCTFIAPSVMRRGALVVAVSTGGGSPALSKHVRQVVDGAIDPAYGDLLALLTELRPHILREVRAEHRGDLWDRLLNGELLQRLRVGAVEEARTLAQQIIRQYRDASTPGSV